MLKLLIRKNKLDNQKKLRGNVLLGNRCEEYIICSGKIILLSELMR